MQIQAIQPQMVGVTLPADPNIPVIMASVPRPPYNENPGIVPPWLQQAQDDYSAWKSAGPYDDYMGDSPYAAGLTVAEVAAMYREAYWKATTPRN